MDPDHKLIAFGENLTSVYKIPFMWVTPAYKFCFQTYAFQKCFSQLRRYICTIKKSTETLSQTNAFRLDLRPASWEGIHAWYYKPPQKPLTREVVGPRRKPTVVLLNGHVGWQTVFWMVMFTALGWAAPNPVRKAAICSEQGLVQTLTTGHGSKN